MFEYFLARERMENQYVDADDEGESVEVEGEDKEVLVDDDGKGAPSKENQYIDVDDESQASVKSGFKFPRFLAVPIGKISAPVPKFPVAKKSVPIPRVDEPCVSVPETKRSRPQYETPETLVHDVDDEREFQEDAEEQKAPDENKSLQTIVSVEDVKRPSQAPVKSGFKFHKIPVGKISAPVTRFPVAKKSAPIPRVDEPRASEPKTKRSRPQYEMELKRIPRNKSLPEEEQDKNTKTNYRIQKYNEQVQKNNAELRMRSENSGVEMEDDSSESTEEESSEEDANPDESGESFINNESSSELSTSSSEKRKRRKKKRTEGAVAGRFKRTLTKRQRQETRVQDWNMTLPLPKMAPIQPNEIDAALNDTVYLQMMEAAVYTVGGSIILPNCEAPNNYQLIAFRSGSLFPLFPPVIPEVKSMGENNVIIELVVSLARTGNSELLDAATVQRDCFKLARTIIGAKSSQEIRRLIDTRVYTGSDENSWFPNMIALDEYKKNWKGSLLTRRNTNSRQQDFYSNFRNARKSQSHTGQGGRRNRIFQRETKEARRTHSRRKVQGKVRILRRRRCERRHNFVR